MKLFNHIGIKTAAVMLAAGGLGVGLIGSGVRASFTDTGSATANVAVGTFGISLSSSTPSAVVVNTGTAGSDTHTVTLTCPTIQASTAGSCPLDFKVTNTGSMPATVTVASSDGFSSPWSDNFTNPGPQTIAAGGNYDYTGGIKWTALSDADLGSSHSVTYTITATN